MNSTMIYLTIANFCYFPLMFRTENTLNESENNERFEIKPRTMLVLISELNIWLVGWWKDPTNSKDTIHMSNNGLAHSNCIVTCLQWKIGLYKADLQETKNSSAQT